MNKPTDRHYSLMYVISDLFKDKKEWIEQEKDRQYTEWERFLKPGLYLDYLKVDLDYCKEEYLDRKNDKQTAKATYYRAIRRKKCGRKCTEFHNIMIGYDAGCIITSSDNNIMINTDY